MWGPMVAVVPVVPGRVQVVMAASQELVASLVQDYLADLVLRVLPDVFILHPSLGGVCSADTRYIPLELCNFVGPLCQYISLTSTAFFQVVTVSYSLPLLWEEDHELGDCSSRIVCLVCPSMPGHLLWYCMLASTSILSWGAVFNICRGIVVLDLTPPPPSVCCSSLVEPGTLTVLSPGI